MERPVDLRVLGAGVAVDQLPAHVRRRRHPVDLDHVVFPLDPLRGVVTVLGSPCVEWPLSGRASASWPSVLRRAHGPCSCRHRGRGGARGRARRRLRPGLPAGASCRTWGSGRACRSSPRDASGTRRSSLLPPGRAASSRTSGSCRARRSRPRGASGRRKRRARLRARPCPSRRRTRASCRAAPSGTA